MLVERIRDGSIYFNSTAFMLRVLTNSVIDTTANDDGEGGNLPLKFIFELGDGKLTGVWENDHQYFKLKELDPQSQESRLIMGLGPSAAGKTFWARNVIKLMGKGFINGQMVGNMMETG